MNPDVTRILTNAVILLREGLFTGQAAPAVAECSALLTKMIEDIAAAQPAAEPKS
jgi:hypothetical protein